MSDDSAQPLIESLTGRESDILSLLAEEKTNQEIADTLVLSVNTVKWYARQIYGKLGVGDRQAAVRRALALGLLPAEQTEAMPEHNLPAQLTPFVGREYELAELEQLLLDPAVRLITVLGPGGMGKTRLALQTATALLPGKRDLVRDGLTFVSLADVGDVQGVAELLAERLGLTPVEGESDPALRLRRYLGEKQMLLLLDSVEHLVGQALTGWLEALLGAAAGVTVLVTSRRRMNVRGEHLHWVEGLQLPPPAMEGQQPEHLLEASSALVLYLQTARRVQPGFTLTPEIYPAVSEICRLTEGMPLGIELAAAWMGLLAPDELVNELRQTPDILATEAETAPAAQRSLRAVFDTSWRLLARPERQAIRALSYFRGGFSRRAAKEVCDVTLPALLSLVNKCWLRRGEGGRFSMHELLRQYGVEALAAESEQHSEILRRHSAYYCDWLAAQEEAILGPQQGMALAAIGQEIANIRLACLVAARTGQTVSLARAVPPLGLYYRWRGGYVAGDNLLETLLQEVVQHAAGPEAGHLARARLLVWHVTLKSLLGQYQRATALGEEALAFLDQLEQAGREMGLERLQIAVQQGYAALLGKRRPEEALRHFSEAYHLAQPLDSRWVAVAQVAVARARRNLGQLEDAEGIAKKGVEILREKGSPSALAEAIALHGNILARMGRFREAEALLKEDPHLSPAHPGIEAYRLVNLARTRFLLGKFDQAEAAAVQGIARYLENETLTGLAWTQTLCAIRLHQGRYTAAVATISEFLPAAMLARRPELQANLAHFQGIRALMAGEWAEARDYLQRSRAARPSTPDLHHNWVDACLALVHRTSGSEKEAPPALAAELRLTLASRAFPALMLALPLGALLLADRGEVERATEIYTRIWQEPFAHNSVWLREVAGEELAEIAARLPVEVREKAQERGRALDLWETAADLLEALAA